MGKVEMVVDSRAMCDILGFLDKLAKTQDVEIPKGVRKAWSLVSKAYIKAIPIKI